MVQENHELAADSAGGLHTEESGRPDGCSHVRALLSEVLNDSKIKSYKNEVKFKYILP